MRLASLLALLCVPAGALAQPIVVDPGGGGDFTGLQAAIDAASPGGVILVAGGCHPGIVIDKPLTITGSATIVRTTIGCPSGPGPMSDACPIACPALRVAAAGGPVVLAGITIDGRWDASFDDSNVDATIVCASGSDLRLHDCTVTGPIAEFASGSTTVSSPAIEAFDSVVTLVRSHVVGGEHVNDSPFSDAWMSNLVVPGPPAILARDVVLLDSLVVGGTQGDYAMFDGDSNCPPDWPSGVNPEFGSGGTGIVAVRVFRANGLVRGGAGGTMTESCGGGPPQPYTQQPVGTACVCNLQVVLADDLASSGAPVTGGSWTVTAAGNGGVLAYGAPSPLPTSQGAAGLLFVAPPFALFAPGPAQTLGVPAAPALIGFQVAAQWLAPQGVLSRPVFEVVQG